MDQDLHVEMVSVKVEFGAGGVGSSKGIFYR